MKTLSLTQPWASLVALGAKKIETRSWKTPHRGLIAIHAALSMPHTAREFFYHPAALRVLTAVFDSPEQLPRGAVVAIAELVDVVPITHDWIGAAEVSEGELSFGNYHVPGRFAWLLDEITRLEDPIKATGALGLWEWTMPETWFPWVH